MEWEVFVYLYIESMRESMREYERERGESRELRWGEEERGGRGGKESMRVWEYEGEVEKRGREDRGEREDKRLLDW